MTGMGKVVMIVALTSALMGASDKWFNDDRFSETVLFLVKQILH